MSLKGQAAKIYSLQAGHLLITNQAVLG